MRIDQVPETGREADRPGDPEEQVIAIYLHAETSDQYFDKHCKDLCFLHDELVGTGAAAEAPLRYSPARDRTARRASGVSQALRALSEDPAPGQAAWELSGDGVPGSYRIRVAADRCSREKAYALAYRLYRDSGYLPSAVGKAADRSRLLVFPYDAAAQTFTLLAEDAGGRAAGTVSLVADSPAGLPCDEPYGQETAKLRAPHRRLTEVTRLAIDPTHRHCKMLLVGLINFLFIHGTRNRRYTDGLLEVNPRHAGFYRRYLGYRTLGGVRSCARANGAPAVLLGMDLEHYRREVRRIGGSRRRGLGAGERTLYSHFFSWEEENAVAEFLARSHRPMSESEQRYFGLDDRHLPLPTQPPSLPGKG